MSFETKLVYSEPLMRQAVLGYLPRRFGRPFLISIVVAAIVLVGSLMAGEELLAIFSGTLLATAILSMPAIYLSLYGKLIRQIREIRELDGGNLCVDDSKLAVSSRLASSTYDWSLVTEIWQLRDVWLLLFGKSMFVVLPKASMPAAMQAFIVERVKAAGGRVS